jgi:hypothetical protein
MRRSIAFVLAALVLGVTAGCAPGGSAGAGSGQASGPYASIAISGPHEKAALAALPGVLKVVADSTTRVGGKPTDVGSAKATLVSYVVVARVGSQFVQFEVRADGVAYGLLQYPTKASSKTLLWQPAAKNAVDFSVSPASDAERSAVSAVTAIVKTAKPGVTATVRISGYAFYWLNAGGQPVKTAGGTPFRVTVDPAGHASSWSM